MERLILRLLLVIGLACLPFTFAGRNVKERAIVFFSTGYFASSAAQYVVREKKLNYTVRPLRKYFDTNVLYEHLLLPLLSVWFMQTTSRSKLPGIIAQAFMYSGAHTSVEYFIEKKTKLIKWKKWSWVHNVCALTMALLGSRGILSVFRWLSKRYDD
ncbi:hypothetical protein HUG15_21805 [Salicibibacter cibarius]|uniref:Uncharacterized protein n=1 Tax=Salicibibacter cibarius TaxID=2743000 RepID=A0A7T6Z6L4_9BACI|nr:CBO0543 family protein [Salicibibacter cibarius]QQK77953.1 hypothetical protein HUG15_21805 [Salicibibacter cibarius]